MEKGIGPQATSPDGTSSTAINSNSAYAYASNENTEQEQFPRENTLRSIGPQATPPAGTSTAINSNSAYTYASNENTEQEQFPRENTLKRRRTTFFGTSPFEELSFPPVPKPVPSTPNFDTVFSNPYSNTTILRTSPFEELSFPPVPKPVPSTPNFDAVFSNPYFNYEYSSPYVMPKAQDRDVKEVKVEGHKDRKKKNTRVSQACDMCRERKTKASVARSALRLFAWSILLFLLSTRVVITYCFMPHANKNDVTVRLEWPMPLMSECECALY